MKVWLLFSLAWSGVSAGLVGAAGVKAVATTGMVGDMVARVGGSRVEVETLMGPGVDPHLYKPTSADAGRLARADVIFYNGLMLEGRMTKLFERLAASGRKVFAVSSRVAKDQLLSPKGFEGHYDPHVWFDVSLWAKTIPVIVDGLSEVDPAGAAEYRANGDHLLARLAALDKWCKERAVSVPEGRRVLVTSHDAYNYFGRAYGFQVVGLQGVSTVSEAALADVAGLTDFLKERKVPAIFVESSVNPEAIRRVSENSGVKVGGELFSDAMGSPGEMVGGFDVGTYEGMVRYNMATIVEALK
ncbi:MAG: zinc ABC transporter substrate-binding protein [Terrimicrobiaceae bacterium]